MTTDGLFSQVTMKVRQGLCAMHGHDSLLHFDQGRISLLCTSCGHESPGWEFGGSAKRRAASQAGAAQATRVVMPLVDARKVA